MSGDPNVYAIAIDRFFDRCEELLPKYVSPMRAFLISLMITIIIFVSGEQAILEDKEFNQTSKDPLRKKRWIAFTVVNAVTCLLLLDFFFDKLYYMQLRRANRQHMVNLPWLQRYATATRGNGLV